MNFQKISILDHAYKKMLKYECYLINISTLIRTIFFYSNNMLSMSSKVCVLNLIIYSKFEANSHYDKI